MLDPDIVEAVDRVELEVEELLVLLDVELELLEVVVVLVVVVLVVVELIVGPEVSMGDHVTSSSLNVTSPSLKGQPVTPGLVVPVVAVVLVDVELLELVLVLVLDDELELVEEEVELLELVEVDVELVVVVEVEVVEVTNFCSSRYLSPISSRSLSPVSKCM